MYKYVVCLATNAPNDLNSARLPASVRTVAREKQVTGHDAV